MPFGFVAEAFAEFAIEEFVVSTVAEEVAGGFIADSLAFGEAGVLAGEGAAGLEGAAAFGEAGVLAGEAAAGTQALPFGEAAVQAAAPAAGSSVTGADILNGIKTVAPVVSAGTSLMGALNSADQIKAAKAQADQAKGVAPAVAPALPQQAVDPDLTALRKKNALLFGLDSAAGTDLTGGDAGTGNVGRTTLLGGSSKLGGG